MRTTLDIEDDVLQAAKELARQQQVSAGQVISRLLRAALSGVPADKAPGLEAGGENIAGFRPFAAAGQRLVANEQIDQLRDQGGI
ncbi:MAG: hypothetical protein C1943_03370 [Halochromatium sp.]|nr:hypothetical protein [Halochromatium sp.]